jgi:peptide subunit release factor RF-3
VELQLSPLPFELARWPQGEFDPGLFRYSERIMVVEDREGRPALLARTAFDIDRAIEKHPELRLSDTAVPELFETQEN